MQPEKAITISAQDIVEEDDRPVPSYSGLFRFCTKADLVLLIPAIAVSVVSGLITPVFTLLLGEIFLKFGAFSTNQIAAGDLEQQILPSIIGICVLGGAAWVLGWLHMSMWLAFGETTARRAREKTIKGILKKSMTWFDKRTVDNGVSGNMNKTVK